MSYLVLSPAFGTIIGGLLGLLVGYISLRIELWDRLGCLGVLISFAAFLTLVTAVMLGLQAAFS